jgi:hypothetical protein
MENGGREAMLSELLNYDISGCNLQDVPKTDALFEQKLHSMNSIAKFWFERLMDGMLHPEHGYWKEMIEIPVLHKAYEEFARSVGDRYPASSSGFGKQLKKLVPWTVRTRATTGNERPWCRQFPKLEECREHFENLVCAPINWDEEVSE